jgi:general secretion pathway protein G
MRLSSKIDYLVTCVIAPQYAMCSPQREGGKGQYPESLDALMAEGYVRKIPVDPITNGADTWQTIAAEPDPGHPSAAPGAYDVLSDSDRTALDGTKYSEWR